MLFQDVKPGTAVPSAVSKGWWVRRAHSGSSRTSHGLPFVAQAPPGPTVHQPSAGHGAACAAGTAMPLCTHDGSGLGRQTQVNSSFKMHSLSLRHPYTGWAPASSAKIFSSPELPWREVLILPELWKPVSCVKKSPPSPNIKTSKRESSSAELCGVIPGLYTNWMLNTHRDVWLTHVASFLHALAASSIETRLSEKFCPERSDTECLGPSGVSQRIWYEGKLQQAKTEAETWPQPWPLVENAPLLVQPQADRHDLIQLFHSSHCMERVSSFAAPRGYKTFFIHPQ